VPSAPGEDAAPFLNSDALGRPRTELVGPTTIAAIYVPPFTSIAEHRERRIAAGAFRACWP
jgi:hypothetical protein